LRGGTKNKLTGEALRNALGNVCRGLFYISETDSEITPVLAVGKRSLVEFANESVPDSPIETKPAEDFFQRLIKDREWHGEDERKRVRRFRKLSKVIFENLEDVAVLRVGRIRIDIFVVGYDADGNIAGIATRSVET
jgi:hypothetical protein